MAKKIPEVKFELKKVYETFKEQLLMAGNVSNFLINNSNINASGNQVEGSVRTFLKQFLPDRVNITQGHIVDIDAKISYQQDILISDNLYSKHLIKTLDGTEFLPYESIFATGEVKKTLSVKYLQSAVKSIKHTKQKLTRRNLPPDVFQVGTKLIKTENKYTSGDYANPLFTFMFSLDFSKLDERTKIENYLRQQTDWSILPNLIVILNQGLYLLVDKEKVNKGELEIKLYPEFCKDKSKVFWIFLQLDSELNLAYMIFLLLQHINDTFLDKVSYLQYAQSIIEISKSNIYPI